MVSDVLALGGSAVVAAVVTWLLTRQQRRAEREVQTRDEASKWYDEWREEVQRSHASEAAHKRALAVLRVEIAKERDKVIRLEARVYRLERQLRENGLVPVMEA